MNEDRISDIDQIQTDRGAGAMSTPTEEMQGSSGEKGGNCRSAVASPMAAVLGRMKNILRTVTFVERYHTCKNHLHVFDVLSNIGSVRICHRTFFMHLQKISVCSQ